MTRQESVGGLARRLWQAVARGDAEAVLALYAPEAVMTIQGRNPLAGEAKGRMAILSALAEAGDWVDELQSELLEVLVGEHSAVIHYRMRAVHDRHELDGEYFMHFRTQDGRIVEAASVPVDPERNDAFWNAVAGGA